MRSVGMRVVVATLLVFPVLGLQHLQAQAPAGQVPYSGPRTPDGKPDLNGIWQVLNSAHWDLEPHSPEEGVPGGQGVVEGGTIPYQPWALAKKQENQSQAHS